MQINNKLWAKQAWLITAEHLDTISYVNEAFVAIFDHRIDSGTMLRTTTDLYKSTFFGFNRQLPLNQDEIGESHVASFMILNDGSQWEDHIVCGHDPGLRSRRVYDITISIDQQETMHLSWREPHVIVNGDMREVEYWEEITLPLVTS